MRQSKSIQVGTRAPLARNILLIEGITRSGKFLLADLLSGFEGVEPVQYRALIEHIPFLERFGFLDTDTARELLKCEVDMSVYEMRIGRALNHRRGDKSSVFNHPRHREFLKRAALPDGDVALAVYRMEKPYSPFIAHETMPHLEIFFDTFPHIRVLAVERSPIDLVHSWWKRGLGKRWGHDPKLFQIPFASPRGPVPWFASGFVNEYVRCSEMDRIITCILTLRKKYSEARKRFSARETKKIFTVRFEDMVMSTDSVLLKLEAFLGRKQIREMSAILKREGLPDNEYAAGKVRKLEEIQAHTSPHLFKLLLNEENQYVPK